MKHLILSLNMMPLYLTSTALAFLNFNTSHNVTARKLFQCLTKDRFLVVIATHSRHEYHLRLGLWKNGSGT